MVSFNQITVKSIRLIFWLFLAIDAKFDREKIKKFFINIIIYNSVWAYSNQSISRIIKITHNKMQGIPNRILNKQKTSITWKLHVFTKIDEVRVPGYVFFVVNQWKFIMRLVISPKKNQLSPAETEPYKWQMACSVDSIIFCGIAWIRVIELEYESAYYTNRWSHSCCIQRARWRYKRVFWVTTSQMVCTIFWNGP